MRPLHLTAIVLLLVASTASLAPAQTSGAQTTDGWDTAKWRFGPLAVTPKVELKNLGWDSNVFNDADDPKSDFTATAGAPIDSWLRFGRGRLHVVNYFEGVYYATYSNQSGFNQRHDGTLMFLYGRIRPYAGGYYLSTNERPGYEVNVRVRHTEENFKGGAVLRLTNRLSFDLSGGQTTFRYLDEDYPGRPYSTGLNHVERTYGGQARYQVTPLTTLTLQADSTEEQFSESPDRDNTGYRILPGVEFDPFALIKGKAQIGYRKFNTLTPGMPDFSGLVASVDLSYDFRGTTRLAFGASRDINFSYELTYPFYIQPGVTFSVTQQIAGPWDVQARGSWFRLDYQSVTPAAGEPPPASRVDRYQILGGGLGYRLGRTIRIGVNVDYSRRESAVNSQAFDGIRGGLSVSYLR